jgi:hypothetical protein
MGKARSRLIGIASLALALLLITSMLLSYKSLQIALLARSKEPTWEKYLISERGLDIRGYLTVRIKLIQTEPFLSIPLIAQLVEVSLISGDEKRWKISGYTNSFGVVTFKLPPGYYEVSTIYHGIITKINITMRSERSWLFADWQYFKRGTKDFQLILKEDRGTKKAKDVVKAILPNLNVPKPLFTELYYRQERMRFFNTITTMNIINYTVVDNQTIAYLKLVKPLSLYEISGTASLWFAVYWARVEVFELIWR